MFSSIGNAGLALHEAYTRYGASRVSCAYCIMSSLDDLRAAASCESNRDVYCAMVDLEVRSSFAFQGNRWLADVAPHLLSASVRAGVVDAKQRAVERQSIESTIPSHMLFTAGWPNARPTPDEARLLADVRQRVAKLLAIDAGCISSDSVLARYDELLARKPQSIQQSTMVQPIQAIQEEFAF